jgi:hypothetical protein
VLISAGSNFLFIDGFIGDYTVQMLSIVLTDLFYDED